jgi:hypothetical protein
MEGLYGDIVFVVKSCGRYVFLNIACPRGDSFKNARFSPVVLTTQQRNFVIIIRMIAE